MSCNNMSHTVFAYCAQIVNFNISKRKKKQTNKTIILYYGDDDSNNYDCNHFCGIARSRTVIIITRDYCASTTLVFRNGKLTASACQTRSRLYGNYTYVDRRLGGTIIVYRPCT